MRIVFWWAEWHWKKYLKNIETRWKNILNHFDVQEVIDEQEEIIEKQAEIIKKLTSIVQQNKLLDEYSDDETIDEI